MGYTPEEMVELMLSEEFSYWQTGTVENEYKYYFKRPDPTPEFGHFSIDMTDSLQVKASFLPQSLINPDRKSTRLNSSHASKSRMPSSA